MRRHNLLRASGRSAVSVDAADNAQQDVAATVVIVNISVDRVPRVPLDERIEFVSRGEDIYEVDLHYGFMQGFDVPSELAICIEREALPITLDDVTYYVGKTSVIAGLKEGGMMTWRDRLFSFMVRIAPHVTSQFQIPPGQLVEIGLQMAVQDSFGPGQDKQSCH